MIFGIALLCMPFISGCDSGNSDANSQPIESHVDTGHIIMFDGKSLGQWQISDFYKPGNVYVKDGSIYI